MKKNAIYLLLTSAMATMVFTSCASYKKPFEAVSKSSYTTLTDKEKCMLPKNLKFLTCHCRRPCQILSELRILLSDP